MFLHVWQDWQNEKLFNQYRIMPLLEKYLTYRYEFPKTIQIVLNNTDMCRRPFCIPYWRPGDPILYRAPAYNRKELYPLPPEDIWAYEMIYGEPCFETNIPAKHSAGFVGTQTGPSEYRKKVAIETSKVGIGICKNTLPFSKKEYCNLLSGCNIIVCPRGWGEVTSRHWDAWLSGKPVLTDRQCDSVEMIPGIRLKEGIHYLVFDEPEDIPDIVSDWTRKSKLDNLKEIAENGREAALSYNALVRIVEFFNKAVNKD